MFIGTLIYSLVNSVILALIALGFNLTFGISNIANFAYGALYILSGFGAWMLLNTLGLPFFVAVPLMLLLFMIPISIGGIGLQEWAYFFVLSMVGVPAAVGLSLGLIFRARTIGFGLLGGIIYPFIEKSTQPSL